MSTTPGARIGPCVVESEIGRGGMGVVYRARDERLDRLVAIKSLPEHFADDAMRLARFEREARTLAQLNHPNVGGIHGVEEQDGQRYLVLEYVEGDTLADRLDAGPIPLDDALEIAVGIAAGLEAAHAAGVIHRDLKPDNVKITPGGDVKVLDFGLARSTDATSSAEIAADDPTIARSPTIPGAVLGTAGYLSPEQARGRPTDARTDIWSFGVVLYEMLTGANPFAGETVTDSIGAVLHVNPDEDRLPPGTPASVRRTLRRCLARDPKHRLHHLADARLEIEDALAGDVEPTTATDGDRRRGPGMLAWGGWLVAVAAVIAAAWFGRGGQPTKAALVRSSISSPAGIIVGGSIISPDDRHVTMIATPSRGNDPGADAVRSLFVRALASDRWLPVPQSEGVFWTEYAPDGGTFGFITQGRDAGSERWLYRAPADLSAPPVRIMEVGDEFRVSGPGWFAWTPDGSLALFSAMTETLVIIDPGTGRELRRVPVSSDLDRPDIDALLTPFGSRHIGARVQSFEDGRYRHDAAVIDVETGVLSLIAENTGRIWMTSPRTVVFARQDTLYASGFDPETLTLRGTYRPVQAGLRSTAWGHGDFTLSRAGTLVYTPGGIQGTSRELVVVNMDGTVEPLGDDPRGYEESPAISPDGTKFVVLLAGDRGLFELWGAEIDNPRLRRIFAAAGGDVYEPVFLDDEHVIVARWDPSADEPGTAIVVPFDGGGAPHRIHGGWGRYEWVDVHSASTDGLRAYAAERRQETARIVEIDVTGELAPRVLLEGRSLETPVVAPNGAPLLAYISEETGRHEAYVSVIGPDGLEAAIPVTTRGAWSTAWSVDDAGVLRLHHDGLDGLERVTVVTWDGAIRLGATTTTERVARNPYVGRGFFPDGRQLAIRRGADEQPAIGVEMVQGLIQSIGP